MTIEFKEAVFGKETDITIPRTEDCDTCQVSGAKPGTKPETCSVCRGTGQQEMVQNTAVRPHRQPPDVFGLQRQGQNHPREMRHLPAARGKVQKQRKIHIKIPAGVDDGAQMRVSGEGERGRAKGGPPGDLYIVIRVKPHDFFEREGDDIYCEVPLTFAQAALGDEIEIPTLTEKVKLKIPPGTQTDTYFRLKGKGVPRLRGYGQGDQHVKVVVVTPTNLDEEQKELLRAFSRATGDTAHEHQSLFERMRKAFRGE